LLFRWHIYNNFKIIVTCNYGKYKISNPIFWFKIQMRIHDCNPINKLSMIYSRNHQSKFIVKILHLILLVSNWQNGRNSINILWPHLFHHPPFIGVISVRDSIYYICQCYFGIRHFYLVHLSLLNGRFLKLLPRHDCLLFFTHPPT
jgi:hypothetical protein